jgi:hypothetical protein
MSRLGRTILVVVGIALAGVGTATAADATLSKHVLDARASAACQTASNANTRVVLSPRPTNAAGWLRYGATLHAIESREIKALERLSPPASLAKLWRTYLRGLHHEERAIEPLFRAYASGDKAEVRKLVKSDQRLGNRDSNYARKLGAFGCV